MQTFRFSYIRTWYYYSAVINHLIMLCFFFFFFYDTNSNRMNFLPKLLVKRLFLFNYSRGGHKKRQAEREIKGKETRTVQNVKEEAGAGPERGDGNRGRDRDKLPPWHCVIRILCRLKCFTQVEISIKCCCNFLFKPTSWLNRQIITQAQLWSVIRMQIGFCILTSCVGHLNLKTGQVCKVWGRVSMTPKKKKKRKKAKGQKSTWIQI